MVGEGVLVAVGVGVAVGISVGGSVGTTDEVAEGGAVEAVGADSATGEVSEGSCATDVAVGAESHAVRKQMLHKRSTTSFAAWGYCSILTSIGSRKLNHR
jgi:hypothetical protein